MYLTSKHGICPTLIHSIKPYHSSSKIYPRAVSISQGENINKALIKHIHHVHQPNQMHFHVIMHDLPYLPCCSIKP